MFLVIPYMLSLLGIAGIATIPFYFINKFLIQKIKPRESGKKLLLYFVTVIAVVFVYITAGIYLLIYAVKIINKT